MTTDAQKRLAKAVCKAAGEAVEKQGFASAIDVLVGIGWLAPENLAAWRSGKVPYLEQVVTANLSKISRAMKAFRAWAAKAKLKPSRTDYRSFGKEKRHLRFSKSGTPSIEAAYSTHFVLVRSETPRSRQESDAS